MKIPGLYIAHHITFDAYFGANQVFKVGHTSDLRRHLQDNAFQTCFLHKFKFVATVETETVKKAQQLEKTVLRKLGARGSLSHRDNGVLTETAHLPMGEIIEIIKELGEKVKIGPCYSTPQDSSVSQIFADCVE